MLSQCPLCQKSLRLSDEQSSRLKQALSQLAPGKLLTIKCPHCREPIGLDQTGELPPKAGQSCDASATTQFGLAADRAVPG